MKYQLKDWTCGPAAVRNLLYCYGIRTSEKKLYQLLNTSKGWTDPTDIYSGMSKFMDVKRLITKRKSDATTWIRSLSAPAIALVMNGEHWVTIINLKNEHVLILDSSYVKYNRKENGARVLSMGSFMRHWYWGKKRVYLAIKAQ
jgi:ABC-type bacteriocin/lantibiotic exporter with double-glycine peptidase domain